MNACLQSYIKKRVPNTRGERITALRAFFFSSVVYERKLFPFAVNKRYLRKNSNIYFDIKHTDTG